MLQLMIAEWGKQLELSPCMCEVDDCCAHLNLKLEVVEVMKRVLKPRF